MRVEILNDFESRVSLIGPDLSGHFSHEWGECIRVNGVNE